jgi:hypothetical protein
MSATLAEAAPLLVAGVGTAVVLGGVRWVRALVKAIITLTSVVKTLADVSGDLVELREEFLAHVRESDARWRMVGGAVHPRYLTADDRVPEPAGSPE